MAALERTEDFSTVNQRLASFKKRGSGSGALKWPHKGLSMISMARSFFYYSPTPSARDRTACSFCGHTFQNWAHYKGIPLLRHAAAGDKNCAAAVLAGLLLELRNGHPVSSSQFKKACLTTFTNSSTHLTAETAEKLASHGFIFQPVSERGTNLVSCIACKCQPQGASSTPKHMSACSVAYTMAASSAVSSDALEHVAAGTEDTTANSPLPSSAKLIGAKACEKPASPAGEPTTADCDATGQGQEPSSQSTPQMSLADGASGLEPLPAATSSATNVEKSSQSCSTEVMAAAQNPAEIATIGTKTTDEAETSDSALGNGGDQAAGESHALHGTAAARCHMLFDRLAAACLGTTEFDQVNLQTSSALEVLARMEIQSIRMLEEAHARRIQLINQETERVVSQVLAADL